MSLRCGNVAIFGIVRFVYSYTQPISKSVSLRANSIHQAHAQFAVWAFVNKVGAGWFAAECNFQSKSCAYYMCEHELCNLFGLFMRKFADNGASFSI